MIYLGRETLERRGRGIPARARPQSRTPASRTPFSAITRLLQGRAEEALPLAQAEPHDVFRNLGARDDPARDGTARRKRTLRCRRLIDDFGWTAAYQVAEVYADAASVDKAFEWLEKAYVQRDPGVVYSADGPLPRIRCTAIRAGSRSCANWDSATESATAIGNPAIRMSAIEPRSAIALAIVAVTHSSLPPARRRNSSTLERSLTAPRSTCRSRLRSSPRTDGARAGFGRFRKRRCRSTTRTADAAIRRDACVQRRRLRETHDGARRR